MIRTTAVALAALIALPGLAAAHSNDARMTEQAGKIERGRQTGAITWREGIKLRKEQREIARTHDKFASDGRLTVREKRALHAMQNQASRHIASEKNDGWRRWWVLPRVGR